MEKSLKILFFMNLEGTDNYLFKKKETEFLPQTQIF